MRISVAAIRRGPMVERYRLDLPAFGKRHADSLAVIVDRATGQAMHLAHFAFEKEQDYRIRVGRVDVRQLELASIGQVLDLDRLAAARRPGPDDHPRGIVDRAFERSAFRIGVFQRRRSGNTTQMVVDEQPLLGDRELAGIGGAAPAPQTTALRQARATAMCQGMTCAGSYGEAPSRSISSCS